MSRLKERLVIAAATAGLLVPAAVFATQIVFDPTNFDQLAQEVAQDTELLRQLRQQVQNQVDMLRRWGYSQLDGILRDMQVWQQVLGQAGSTYSSAQPGQALDRQYPPTPEDYTRTSDTDMTALRGTWDQRERQVLIENRTVQNDMYRSLEPTAQRIEQYVKKSNAAPGMTAAVQASNEELATLIAQLQSMQAQEITDARTEVEQEARDQAEEAYAERQRQAVRADWDNPPRPTTNLVDAFPMANQ